MSQPKTSGAVTSALVETDAERSCADVTTGEARYLMALLEMQREGRDASLTQATLARHLGVSGPAVFEMVRRLRGLGLVEPDSVRLTPRGISAALVLSSRRHAALALTRDVLGMEGERAEAEATWLATSASPALGRHLVAWRARREAAGGGGREGGGEAE